MASPVRDTEAVHRAVHRAAVETLVLHRAGRDLAQELKWYTPIAAEDPTEGVNVIVNQPGDVYFDFAGAEEAILQSLKQVEPPIEEVLLDTPEGGVVKVELEAEATAEELAAMAEPETTEAEQVDIEAAEDAEDAAAEAVASEAYIKATTEQPRWLSEGLEGKGWTQLPVTDLTIRFAVRNHLRLSFLGILTTGCRL